MKNILTLVLLCSCLSTQAQYFQDLYNYDYANAQFRAEHFNSGIRSRENLNANGNPNSYVWTGIGVSLNNAAVLNNNQGDEVRFIKTNNKGVVNNNLGYLFRDNVNGSKFYNSAGNSIAEIKNSTFNGGYISVGAVTNNSVTGAVAPGGSDGLFINFSSTGGVVNSSRYDWAGGYDIAWCVRESKFQPGTWLICGETQKAGYTDTWVARVNNVGGILWAFEYGFDMTVTGNTPSSFSKAYQLCEYPTNGNIYVVGTLQDNGSPDIDGLAFGLNAGGGLIWDQHYTMFGAVTDDEFQADRLDFDNNVIVGGFTTAAPTGTAAPNMWIVKLNAANGVIMFQNILQVVDANGKYSSRCRDIIPRQNTAGAIEYYLTGPVYKPGGIFNCIYKANAVGLGINSYSYDVMKFDFGFGIDQAENAVNFSGLGVFSSSTFLGTGFSDSYLLKTYYNGATCTNYCPADPPVNIVQNFGFQTPIPFKFTPVQITTLKSKTFKFQTKTQCNQNPVPCGNNAREDGDNITNIQGLILYPNPAQDQLTIQFGKALEADKKLIVFDATGRMVFSQNVSEGTYNLNIEINQLPAGYYLVKVGEGADAMRKSFIKE